MSAVFSYNTEKQRLKMRAGSRKVEPVVAEIIEALLIHGGAAHRQMVADHIATVRNGRLMQAEPDVQREVFDGFQRYLDRAARLKPAPLLHLPLGKDSHRWALTSSGQILFAAMTQPSMRQMH